ncbi:hypothetical protein EJ110_NYTH36646 [Nymphaea thermarum]|nr:hypothetical protein EJ110_NYTH36646 [Nymphaea thermarum]
MEEGSTVARSVTGCRSTSRGLVLSAPHVGKRKEEEPNNSSRLELVLFGVLWGHDLVSLILRFEITIDGTV